LTVQNGSGGIPSNSLPLTVSGLAAGTPQLSGITPGSSVAGQAFTFTITGTGFDPSTALVNFTLAGSTTNTTLSAESATQLTGTVTLTIAGIYNVTVQNGSSGTASAPLSFTVSSSTGAAPTLTSINPTSAVAGQSFTFTINGTGFDQTTLVNFTGPGSPTNLTLATPTATQLTGTVTLTIAGNYNVTVQSGPNGTPSTPPLSFTVSSSSTGGPQLSALTTTPNPPVSGQSFTFTITGTGFDPNSAMVIFTGPGCTSSACGVANSALSTKTSTQLSGSATLIGDSFTVTVQNGSSGTPSNGLTLTVASSTGGTPTPQLGSIATSPNPPVAGQAFTFTITGTGFDPNGVVVVFNGPGCGGPATTCNIAYNLLSSASSTQLIGTAILAGGSFFVTVWNGPVGNISNRLDLVVSGSTSGGGGPQITGISPSSTGSGLAFGFTISGSGFDPSSAVVVFSGTGCTTATCTIANSALTSTSAISLSGQGPALAAGSYTVTVQNVASGTTSNSWPFTVSTSGGAAPSITSIVPNPVLVGGSFTINGSGFDPSSALVTFTGGACTTPCIIATNLLTKSATQVSGTVPAQATAGSYTVTVQNGSSGTPSTGVQLTVSTSGGGAPSITSIVPNPALVGGSFTINGSGFDPTSALVTFTGGACTTPCIIATNLLTKSATQVSGTVPALATAGSYTVTVQNGSSGTPSTGVQLTVSTSGGGAPSITSIVPNPALVGGSFTINGSGFDPTSARVTFTGGACTTPCIIATNLLTKSATQVSGTVPAQATAGSYTVTVQNGSSGTPSTGVPLTVSTSGGTVPSITSIVPNPVLVGG